MMAYIEALESRKIPYLIVKYQSTFVGMSSSCYDIVTLGCEKLNYAPIDRRLAREAIRRFDIPLLHSDGRDMIWGDANFKKKFQKSKCKI